MDRTTAILAGTPAAAFGMGKVSEQMGFGTYSQMPPAVWTVAHTLSQGLGNAGRLVFIPGQVLATHVTNDLLGRQVPTSSFELGSGQPWELASAATSVALVTFVLPKAIEFTSTNIMPTIYGRMSGIGDWFERFSFGRRATSSFAGAFDVLSNRWREGDLFLGTASFPFGIASGRPVGIPTEKHMLTIAAPGSGKTTAGLIPNLLIHEGSLLCIDPKGELATITAGPRERRMGQEVHVLDPSGIVAGRTSACYNPFDELAAIEAEKPDAVVGYAELIARALVPSATKGDPYWDNAARTFAQGVVLYITQQEPPERRNLIRFRELLAEGDVDAYNAAVAAGAIKENEVTSFDVLLEQMKASREGRYGYIISAAARTIDMMGDKQRGSVLTTLQQHTSFLDSPEIRKLCLKSDFLLRDFKTKKMSVYLSLPIAQVKGAQGVWLRLFVVTFIDMMQRNAQAPKPPVLLAIDEFPSLGRIDGIEVVGPVMRSFGVRLWAIAQDIDQLRAVYPESWETLIGCAEAVQFMGIKHPGTVKAIVELLGRHRVFEGKNYTERSLLDAEQVSRLLAKGDGKQIIWRGDRKPMLLKIAPYYKYFSKDWYDQDPRFKGK